MRTGPGNPAPATVPVHVLIAAQAKAAPTRVAAVCGPHDITYAALQQRARSVACHLRRRGVGAGSLVGLYIGRSIDMVVGMLAIMQAGAAYVPLEPDDPGDRLRFFIKDTGVVAVLTSSAHLGKLANLTSESTAMALCMDRVTDEAGIDVDPPAGCPDDLVYVIYTSGSTGQPKGVAMTHAAAGNLMAWQMRSSAANLARARGRAPQPERLSRNVLQFTPLTFDVSFLEVCSALCAGATIVIPQPAQRADFGALLALIAQQHIGSVFLPMTALDQLAEMAVRNGIFPPSLCEVMTGGEQLRITPAMVAWFDAMPWCSLHNIYGPTEAHVVTSYRLEGDPHRWPPLAPIGTPIDNAEIYLLDDALRPVAAGESGEIHIGGVCLSRGYLNRPALNAERFIAHPFGPGRLYKTGDLAHYQADGNLMYEGRRDAQVKIQGVRVEPGEVEHALGQHEDVFQCAVVASDDVFGHQRLIAYIVERGPGRTRDGDASGLTRHMDAKWSAFLDTKLPAAAIPRTFMLVSALPVTVNGKIDRKALPPPSTERPMLEAQLVAPSTPTERIVARLWQECLQLRMIGVDDGFFELGGHSLMLVHIQNRLSAWANREIAIAALLQHPTVRRLSSYLDAGAARTDERQAVARDARQTRRGALIARRAGGEMHGGTKQG